MDEVDLEFPAELLAQLSYVPEDRPPDFTCVICERVASNRFGWSPRTFERPPICMSCESVSGYSWTGAAKVRAKPIGGSFRDRREAIRIAALADAISEEANRQKWEARHGRT